jgi:hypothetical protein
MTNHKISLLVALAAAIVGSINAFVPSNKLIHSRAAATELQFGFPTFEPKKDDDGKDPKDEKKIDAKGVIQLIAAGMGAPFLGDFQGVDKETGKFMFSLEANNLVDEEGKSKQTAMPYFESGWVDPEDAIKEQKRKEDGFKFPWQK